MFNCKREVIDYKQLSLKDIEILISRLGGLVDDEMFVRNKATMEGVEGRKVTGEKDLWHPGPGFRTEMPNVETRGAMIYVSDRSEYGQQVFLKATDRQRQRISVDYASTSTSLLCS